MHDHTGPLGFDVGETSVCLQRVAALSRQSWTGHKASANDTSFTVADTFPAEWLTESTPAAESALALA